jgi:hypothetical protein
MDEEADLLNRVMQCLVEGQLSIAQDKWADALQEAQWIRQYRQAALMLIERYLDGPYLAAARQAYDTGVVDGFYGLGLRSTEVMGGAVEDKDEFPDELARVRRKMSRLGYRQGCAMRSASKAEAKSRSDSAV